MEGDPERGSKRKGITNKRKWPFYTIAQLNYTQSTKAYKLHLVSEKSIHARDYPKSQVSQAKDNIGYIWLQLESHLNSMLE